MAARLGLLDVLQRVEKVKVSDEQSVDVIGLSSKAIGVLIERFPDLISIMTGSGGDIAKLRKSAPEAIAALIAAATGDPGNVDAEAVAERLPVGVQMNILKAMGRVTFPDGFGPFVESLQELSGGITEAVTKASGTKSPMPPQNLEPQETPPSSS
jgi:hypothetical protein